MPQQPVRIAPSILSADFAALGPRDRGGDGGRRRLDPCRCDGQPLRAQPHHRADGGEGAAQAQQASRSTCHLMVTPVDPLVPAFVEAGADTISFHPEAGPHVHRTIQLIKSLGKRAGCVLNPATPLAAIEHVLGDLDLVLVMSVNPGFGGQAFIESQLAKIAALRKAIDALGKHDRPRGRWRRQSGDGQALHRRPAPTPWWPAPRCSPAARTAMPPTSRRCAREGVATGSQRSPASRPARERPRRRPG